MNYMMIFQRQVAEKMTSYFQEKFKDLSKELGRSYSKYNHCKNEYERQYLILSEKDDRYKIPEEWNEGLLRGLSEAVTEYREDYLTKIIPVGKKIYSPRVDIAFTPVLKKKKGGYLSIGVKKLTEDVSLYEELSQLSFVKDIESSLKKISSINFACHNLERNFNDLIEDDDNSFINERPLMLFGFEIENSSTKKYLMGDFLNMLCLAKIPCVIVPDSQLENCIDMLQYCKTIKVLKKVPVYDLLKKVNVLTINQLKEILNSYLIEKGIEPINF